jgi:hypothetical protein
MAALLVGTFLMTGAWSYPQPMPPVERVDAEIAAALNDIGQIELAVRSGNRYAAERELNEIRARLMTIRALVDVHPGPAPIAPAALDRVLRRLSMTWDVRAKLDIVAHVASDNYFTVAQVLEVTQVFYGQREKIDVIETLAPRIIDPQNHGRLYAVVVHPDARARLDRLFAPRAY